MDINIVPLELGNPFCEAKSELKFFEAGIVGVPTVAVANRTFSEAIEEGVDGFLAKDTQQWIEKLELLILDANLRKEMGKKARGKASSKYCTKAADNKPYYDYLRSKVG
ncbi:MAG: Glycosyl transferase group 1 [Candidatus Moranbacteria bacterium GW2011_GWE2_47_10]|nr:MAG: Glycosyl transferase group 1 [Candidatus Moranbacteria bacterium GW2011_GWE2_47_10]